MRVKQKLTDISTLIFDADDTLWENNIFFLRATWAYYNLFPENSDILEQVKTEFGKTEKQIVNELGCGSASFIEILRRLTARFGKHMAASEPKNALNTIIENFLDHRRTAPPLFKNVKTTLERLNKSYRLLALTKGQNDEQNEKIDMSGLRDFFERIFIVPEKKDETYQNLIAEMNLQPAETVMIGNSQKSDINPALRCGMFAIYIPYNYTWTMDKEELLTGHPRLTVIRKFAELTDYL